MNCEAIDVVNYELYKRFVNQNYSCNFVADYR